jgi:transcriptional regulator with XRE-family HTH domain
MTEKIRLVRRNLGLTQIEFAERVGVSTRAVQHWESGQVPGPRQLRRIAQLAERPVAWFYEDVEAVA